MATQPETRLQQKIQKAIKKRWREAFLFKHWGGPFSSAGIPDLIVCIQSRFIALEVKLPKTSSKTSKIQEETIEDIKRAGGCSGVVRSVEEALWLIEAFLNLPWYEINASTGCWETSVYRKLITISGKRYRAYRIAYRLFKRVPDEGMFICHSCDNPHCINPDHLWEGTSRENTRDKVSKGRQRNGASPGELNGSSKLTWTEVGEIRSLYETEEFTYQQLATIFGVAKSQISLIVKEKSWRR